MKLAELVRDLGGEAGAASDAEITDVRLDSRAAGPGVLFAALPGTREDGAHYAAQALERGSSVVLAPRAIELPRRPSALWVHPEARAVAGRAASRVHGNPAAAQRVVGVTGTNGKSTVVHLVNALLAHAGHRPGCIGTVEVRLHGAPPRPSQHTTPDGPELARLARENLVHGGDAFVLEVSSHALDQERLAGFPLDVAIFTNLTRDHLDYHSTFEAYALAKERIFGHLKSGGAAVINADDPSAERMLRAARAGGAHVYTYGTRSHADLSAVLTQVGPAGTTMFLEGMGIPRTGLFLPLVGRHNVENALAALAAVLFLGASPSTLIAGLASLTAPRGRLQPIDTGERGFQVFVDYAHTPDALERVLATLRGFVTTGTEAPSGRLICVFGCGGQPRSREARADGARRSRSRRTCALVTSDNPRDEDPRAIIEDILPGLEQRPRRRGDRARPTQERSRAPWHRRARGTSC
jgi:UDP-N-acetylmuramoyl-L-alanyl-D-glutamate--2,6-diaminopimelate ligase